MLFPNISEHPGWVRPHSFEWYRRIGERRGIYEYPWRYIPDGPQAEDALTEALQDIVRGRVLDVGCGHGEYALRWSGQAEEIVGLDITPGFLETAKRLGKGNIRFVEANTKQGLPFPAAYFDAAYTKKGPGSWYAEGNRVVKPGGGIAALHPGADRAADDTEGDMQVYFPGLFPTAQYGGPSFGETLRARLASSGLVDAAVRTIREHGFLPEPEDVLSMACFGQPDEVKAYVRDCCMGRIEDRFVRLAGPKGLPITGYYHLVIARANDRGGTHL